MRAGTLPDVAIDDPEVDAELRNLRPDSFPTRRLQSAYLDWFWRRTVAIAPPGVEVRWHEGTVQWVDDTLDGYEVALADGIRLPADVLVYAMGHNAREPEDAVVALRDAAVGAGLAYVPPAFTADADLSVFAPGDDVIVRGMGLAAVDAVVLLTAGRGGVFTGATTDACTTNRRDSSRDCTSDPAAACPIARRCRRSCRATRPCARC